MPHVPAIKAPRHDPQPYRQDKCVSRLPEDEAKRLAFLEWLGRAPVEQTPDTKKLNVPMIAACCVAAMFFAIAVLAIGFAIGSGNQDSETVRQLSGLVENLAQEVTAARQAEAERQERQEIKRAAENARLAELFGWGACALAIIVLLGICGTYGGLGGLILGVVLIAAFAGLMTGAIDI